MNSADLSPAISHPTLAEPDLPLLHDRTYSARAFRKSANEIMIRGQVQDVRPSWVEGDTEPMTVHHMVVDIVVQLPSMEITDAEVVLETHPHTNCTSITTHYKKLIGLSIARGFTHKIRDLFGGPKGCTHTTALLQAMAPVAIQSIWAMRSAETGDGTPVQPPLPTNPTDDQIREHFAHNLNTCHVWREDGETIEAIKNGEAMEPPIWIVERLEKLGLDPNDWLEQMRG